MKLAVSLKESRWNNHRAGIYFLSLRLIGLIFFSVPRAPPSNIVAINTSSTSLRLDWDEVSFPDQLGIIRGYRLIMWRTNHSAVILRNITILVPTRTFSLLGLEKYTNYTIQVSAFTIKGEGIKSEPTIAITDEDGKWRWIMSELKIASKTRFILHANSDICFLTITCWRWPICPLTLA